MTSYRRFVPILSPGTFSRMIYPYTIYGNGMFTQLLAFFSRKKTLKMATLYGSGKGLVRVMAGLQILIGFLLFIFGILCAALICHWTSKAGLGIWIGVIVSCLYSYI